MCNCCNFKMCCCICIDNAIKTSTMTMEYNNGIKIDLKNSVEFKN